MKHGQPTKESQGKISTFLKSLKGARNKGQSDNREYFRDNKSVPNSTKIGHFQAQPIRSRSQLRKTG